jgi:hypothetical protein
VSTKPIRPDPSAVIPPQTFAALRALKPSLDTAAAAVGKETPFGRKLPQLAKLIRGDLNKAWGSIRKGLAAEQAEEPPGPTPQARDDPTAA